MIISSPRLIASPDVSVFIITYNQEKTIAQTIESILAQQGDFKMEVVIGDDGSADNTPGICKEYQQKYPNQIRLLLKEKNEGIVKNFVDSIRLCRGKYIGICAGDDYWIDELKIEKQLVFFKNNPDYGVVSTGGYRLLVKKNKMVEGIAPIHPVEDGRVFDYTWRGGVYAMPLSLLIKSELLGYVDFDEFIKRDFTVEDVPLQAILAHHTRFGHIPDLCVVYRVYNTSQTFTNLNSPNYLKYHQGLINIRRYLNELFPEVEFSEQWAHDTMVYRKFLIAVYRLDYMNAKKELENLQKVGTKEKRAKKYIKTRIGFYIFAFVKRMKLHYVAQFIKE